MEIAQHAFTRMDGAWFLVLAKKIQHEDRLGNGWEAWKQFSSVFDKNIREIISESGLAGKFPRYAGYFHQGFKNRWPGSLHQWRSNHRPHYGLRNPESHCQSLRVVL